MVLTDEKVSRRHAMIHVQGHGECWLVDLGSANGTYLNDRRVAQPCRLTDGDRIAIARHWFVFRVASAEVTPRIERPAETIQDVRSEQCWLLLADLENSTQFLQRLPAKEIPRVTGRWLASCKQLIDENQGTINKFLGDGFFAFWRDGTGAAAAVARALRALRELQARDELRFRVVLHYGAVLMGGGASLGEESLLGSEVNFVFRMEKVASSLAAGCLISAAARGALAAHLPTGVHGRHQVPDFPGEHLFYVPQ